MSAETSSHTYSPYSRRKAVSAQLQQVMTGGGYFNFVIKPNLLPEDVPSDLPRNVSWIGQKGKDSLYRSTEAIGDLLHMLIALDDLSVEDAVVCADSLGVDCFYETELYQLPVAAGTESAATGEMATVSTLRKQASVDPFGGVAEIHGFIPRARPEQRYSDGHNATVTELHPERPDAQIFQFVRKAS